MRKQSLTSIFLAILVAATPLAAQQSGAALGSMQHAQRTATYGRLPLTFEANRGQSSSQVKFVSRGKGYTAFLTAGGMVLSLRPGAAEATGRPVNPSEIAKNHGTSGTTTLQFHLVGANKNPIAVGEDPQAGKVNYFLGNNPAQWHTNVPTFTKVRYKSVYPGIDLIFYGNDQQIEYDFAIAPGGDPRRIQFEIEGASQIALDGEGNLVLSTSKGDLHFQTPIVYQESNGQRAALDGGYVMQDATHIGFQVAHYDSSKPLVIDPLLVYSTYLGGTGTDQPTGVAVDASGNVYVAGYTDSASFPLTTLGSPAASNNHIFVAKLDATASHLIYADYIGGNNQDYGIALTLDSANNVYVTGSTASNNFPVVRPFQAQQPGPYSGFLTKISANGSSLLYSTYLGGNSFDQPTSLAIDGLGQAHVAGFTMSQNFPVANALQPTASANQAGVFGNYGFLTKFSSDGSSLVYSTYLAGSSNVVQDCGSPCWPAPYSVVSSIAVDANGNAYVTGTTNTYNFPATSGAYQASNSSPQDATIGFVSKFNSAGGLGYSTYFYGSNGNPTTPAAIAVDGAGSAYITGVTASDGSFPVTSTSICDPGVDGFACSYAFVTKFDPAGSTLLYSTFLGANNYASPAAIALDTNTDAYVLASTRSATFSTSNDIESYTSGSDILLVEIDPAASTELLATYLGGNGNEQPAALAVDANANVFVAGTTNSTDFPTTQGVAQNVLGGGTDGFVVKIGAALASSVSLSPNSLQYTILPVSSTSSAQTVLLRNMGSSPLSITSTTATGDFAETDNCGSSIPAAATCSLFVTFTPTTSGARTGSIVIQDNAAGSPHVIALTGIGSAASVTLNPASLTFSSTAVGASSASQTTKLTNTGNASLNINRIQATGDFAQSNNCPGVLAPGANCSVTVTFNPTVAGSRSGTLTVSDNVEGGAQTVALVGTGSATDFSLTSSTSASTIKAGATATFALTVTPIGGSFSQAVSFSCTGLPAKATCNFSPSSVTPGSTNASSTLIITTTTSSADARPAVSSHNRPVLAAWFQLQGLGLFGIVLASPKRRSKRLAIFVLLAILVMGMMFMSGCAGGTGIAQQGSTTYTVTVTGTAGAVQHSLPLSLTIQ